MIKAGSSFVAIESLTRCFTERMQGTHFDYEAEQGVIPQDIGSDKYLPIFFKGICPIDLKEHTRADTVKFNPESINGTGIEIDHCIEIAKKLGTDLIFINHTHPVFDFPVVRVIMPGISDFIKWWDPKQATLNLIGNLEPMEQRYEEKLKTVLRSFECGNNNSGKSAQNQSRRDI
jgi:hypothetical protein